MYPRIMFWGIFNYKEVLWKKKIKEIGITKRIIKQ